MRDIRRDEENFARMNRHLAALQLEFQRAFQNIGDLLAIVLVQRNNGILAEKHLGHHGLLTGKNAPRDHVAHRFERYFLPFAVSVVHEADCMTQPLLSRVAA